MRRQSSSGLSKYPLLSFALISMALLLFGCGKGDTGDAGPPGPAGSSGSTSGTVSGNVKNAMSGNPVAGAAVTVSPSVQGVSAISTDASGNYSVNLPNGNYTLTFAKNGYTSQTTGTINVVATQTVTSNIILVPNAGATVNVGADITGKAIGASVALSASVEVYDPSLTGAPTFAWTQTSGPAATITGATTATPTVTLANSTAFKTNLVLANAVRMAPEPTSTPTMAVLNRFMVQPINPFSLGQGAMSTFLVTVTINGQNFTDSINVSVNLPFVPTTGLRNVPIGQRVLLLGKTQASYNWTITSTPAGSTATLNDATTQYPDFIPDVAGEYIINEATSGLSMDIYAGTWVGVVIADGNPGVTPDSACLGCHNGTTAPDKFTPWENSGHAIIMKENIDNPAGHWSATSCGPCHTVGYNQSATAIQNGGWDQVAAVEGFKFTQGPLAWTQTLANYPHTARLSNVQCENCHGPQAGGGAHTLGDPRVDTAGSLCGYCHGEPPRHGRFQEWAQSAHGDFQTALQRGFSTNATTGVTTVSTGCACCHTGQAFLQWYNQLANVGGGRGVGSRTLDATSLANLGWNSSGTLTSSGATVIRDAAVAGVVTLANVQPQTCAVCHDPHDQGTSPTTTPGMSNDAEVRVTDNTNLLPGGFIANGVGRGAVCITCHNSRNGEPVSGGGNPTLHEDGDSNFGTFGAGALTGAGAYKAPHDAAQGDVLMGRNAYFFGNGQVGQRAAHSFLADTCTTCHMELTTPPAAFSGGGQFGTNHGFTTSLNICTNCHGNYNAGTIQAATNASLATLKAAIESKIKKLSSASATIATVSLQPAAGGSPAVNVTYNNGTAALTNATIQTAMGTTPVNNILGKAIWNYYLITNDSSGGIHNPSFIQDVLNVSTTNVNTL